MALGSGKLSSPAKKSPGASSKSAAGHASPDALSRTPVRKSSRARAAPAVSEDDPQPGSEPAPSGSLGPEKTPIRNRKRPNAPQTPTGGASPSASKSWTELSVSTSPFSPASPSKTSAPHAPKRAAGGSFRKRSLLLVLYLSAFNAVSLIMWGMLFYWLADSLFFSASSDFAKASSQLFVKYGPPLVLAQLLSLFEPVHVLLGMVPSPSLLTTLLQTTARLVILVTVVGQSHSAAVQNHPAFGVMALAWALADVLRFSYYLVRCFDLNLAPLSWLRYNSFLVLYPIGVAAEMILLHTRINAVAAGPCSASGAPIALSQLHLLCDGGCCLARTAVLYVLFALYLPLFTVVYGHMLRQRQSHS